MKNNKLLFVSLLSFLAFAIILAGVINHNFDAIDSSTNAAMTAFQNNLFTPIAELVAYSFDVTSILILTMFIGAYLLYKKHEKDSTFFTILIFFNLGMIAVLKEVIRLARPINMIMNETSYAFPSGHAAMAMVLFGFFIYLSWKYLKPESMRWTTILSIAMILLVGFTRVYLNVHWLSDVLGGYALGLCILASGIVFSNIIERKQR